MAEIYSPAAAPNAKAAASPIEDLAAPIFASLAASFTGNRQNLLDALTGHAVSTRPPDRNAATLSQQESTATEQTAQAPASPSFAGGTWYAFATAAGTYAANAFNHPDLVEIKAAEQDRLHTDEAGHSFCDVILVFIDGVVRFSDWPVRKIEAELEEPSANRGDGPTILAANFDQHPMSGAGDERTLSQPARRAA